jgi:hypothetical protein
MLVVPTLASIWLTLLAQHYRIITRIARRLPLTAGAVPGRESEESSGQPPRSKGAELKKEWLDGQERPPVAANVTVVLPTRLSVVCGACCRP